MLCVGVAWLTKTLTLGFILSFEVWIEQHIAGDGCGIG